MAQGEKGGRASRVRIWVGLFAVAGGALLVGDPAQRGETALELVGRWWPWTLLALAGLNLLRSAVPVGSLIGPLALGAVGVVGLVAVHGLQAHLVRDQVAPALLVATGAALVLSSDRMGLRTSWTRLLATGDVVVPPSVRCPVTLRAVLGELRADLGEVRGQVEVNVTAIAGHVRLTVPRASTVQVNAQGALLTRLPTPPSEFTRRPHSEGEFTIHVLGVCGAVSISRV